MRAVTSFPQPAVCERVYSAIYLSLCSTLAVAQEMVRKRRYGRLQKAMGDFCLLAGSPTDAADHFTTAAELSRNCNDSVWCAAAFMGLASAKVRGRHLFLRASCVAILR